MMHAMKRLLLALGVALPALAPGCCWATEPQLYPYDPPPNIPAGQLILQLPDDVVASMRTDHVADELGSILLGDALKIGYEPITEERRKQILAHQVVTGMTLREVKWALVSDPARIRDQGPPGGTTLIWETPGGMHGSFWVRFDDEGRAADAGGY
jgi:hypothetical protein